MANLKANLSVILVLASSSLLVAASLYAGGPPSGVTGGPGDDVGACTRCHFSNGLNSGDGSVDITGPTSYTPDATLEMTIRAARPGAARFGFEIVAKDASDANVGTWEITPGTQHADNGFTPTYLTHAADAPFAADEFEWTVRWIPPTGGAGDVTFYAAANTANGDGFSFGDFIYTTSKPVAMAGGTANETLELPEALVLNPVYPNPARTSVTFSYDMNRAADVQIKLFDTSGKMAAIHSVQSQTSGSHLSTLDVAHLSPGVYAFRLEAAGSVKTGTVSIVR